MESTIWVAGTVKVLAAIARNLKFFRVFAKPNRWVVLGALSKDKRETWLAQSQILQCIPLIVWFNLSKASLLALPILDRVTFQKPYTIKCNLFPVQLRCLLNSWLSV